MNPFPNYSVSVVDFLAFSGNAIIRFISLHCGLVTFLKMPSFGILIHYRLFLDSFFFPLLTLTLNSVTSDYYYTIL